MTRHSSALHSCTCSLTAAQVAAAVLCCGLWHQSYSNSTSKRAKLELPGISHCTLRARAVDLYHESVGTGRTIYALVTCNALPVGDHRAAVLLDAAAVPNAVLDSSAVECGAIMISLSPQE